MKKSEWLVRARKDWAKFKSSNSAILNHMALEFERKKRAEQFKKTQFNNTGVIDTQSLHKFKWSENIFRKSQSVSDGKNHGIIMLVDCSSSMAGSKYIDTIKQTVLLTEFCRKVGIKYKVLGFNDNEPNNKYSIHDDQKYLNKKKCLKFKKYFNLREWLNSEMNKNDHEMMCSYLLMVALGKSYDGFPTSGYASGSSYERSSSKLANPGDIPCSTTPLNDSILVLRQISLKFKEDFKIEVLSTVILTDGESNRSTLFDPGAAKGAWQDGYSSVWRGNSSRSIRINSYDPLSGQYFRTKILNTESILKFYKKCVGGNIIGFFINGHNNEETKYDYMGYDAYFSVANFDMKPNTDNSPKDNRKKNLEKIKNKFTVDHNSLKHSKKILSEMIDILS
tara:strand:+ start:3563 stop:4741 length:1179 start_codon:yes stop_codon:yes gene_type:complete